MFQEIATQATEEKTLQDHLFPTVSCVHTELGIGGPSPETHLYMYLWTSIPANLRFSYKGQVEIQTQ